MKRLSRIVRRHDPSEEDDDDKDDEQHRSVRQTTSESKIRCLTTKRKHKIDVRSTKSDMFHIQKPFDYPNDVIKLDYIIKSFESIEINDDSMAEHERKALKLLRDSDSDLSSNSYVTISNLKHFKESCLLYKVTCIK